MHATSMMCFQLLIDEGTIAEQFIGQHIIDMRNSLLNREFTYWL